MIPKQPGWSMRSLLAAAAICAFAAPPTGVRAEEPSADGWDEVVRSTAEPPAARAAAPLTVRTLRHTFTGTVHEKFRIDIGFSHNVTGFEIGDIQATGATPTGSMVTHSQSSYSVNFTTDPDHVGAVTIRIHAAGERREGALFPGGQQAPEACRREGQRRANCYPL